MGVNAAAIPVDEHFNICKVHPPCSAKYARYTRGHVPCNETLNDPYLLKSGNNPSPHKPWAVSSDSKDDLFLPITENCAFRLMGHRTSVVLYAANVRTKSRWIRALSSVINELECPKDSKLSSSAVWDLKSVTQCESLL